MLFWSCSVIKCLCLSNIKTLIKKAEPLFWQRVIKGFCCWAILSFNCNMWKLFSPVFLKASVSVSVSYESSAHCSAELWEPRGFACPTTGCCYLQWAPGLRQAGKSMARSAEGSAVLSPLPYVGICRTKSFRSKYINCAFTHPRCLSMEEGGLISGYFESILSLSLGGFKRVKRIEGFLEISPLSAWAVIAAKWYHPYFLSLQAWLIKILDSRSVKITISSKQHLVNQTLPS